MVFSKKPKKQTPPKSWILGIEKCFDVLNCFKTQKVILAT